MSEGEKPDGWVAWREDKGADIITTHYEIEGVEIALKANHGDTAGWRIRPVKLVFLDEEPSK